MSRDAQAPVRGCVWLAGPAALLLVCLSAAGCAGYSLDQAAVDRSLYTDSVNAAKTPEDAARLSDEATIRNAVSSADLAGLNGQPLPWANSETGARGTVDRLAEVKGEGRLCRTFTATKESFDGVNLYRGKVCTIGGGIWRMEGFDGQ